MSNLFFGDFDKDHQQEIYVFTMQADSLFLNVNEFFDSSGMQLRRLFITTIKLKHGENTSSLAPCGFFDENGDGKDELYFGISTGFGLEPRLMYSFDLVHQKVKSSPFTGINFNNPVMTDVDGDHRPEIFGTMTASGNYHVKTPFSDNSTWLMILDDQFRFKFPPLEFPGFANGLDIKAILHGTQKGYLVGHRAQGADTTVLKSRIMIFTPDGKLVRERLITEFGISMYRQLEIVSHDQQEQYIVFTNRMIVLNEELEVVKTVELPFHSAFYSTMADLDGDLENELFLYSIEEDKLVAYGSDLTNLGEITLKLPDIELQLSDFVNASHERKLFLKSGELGYFLKLDRNPYYLLGYLIYPASYLFFLLFILLIRKINTYQVAQKESLKRRLLTLQLQSIKAQLDPHFMFNALNSMASLLYLDDRNAAYDHLNKFTRLLRQMINDADRIYRSLQEELEFVTAYLNLEKLRFGDRFTYDIEIGTGVTQKEQVPKMVLQTFAENALKHGIIPNPVGGALKIKVEKEKDYLKLTIEDNGIGRAKAAGKSTSTGKGLKITDEFYEILNQMSDRPVRHTITDLYNETGHSAGTRVEVWVPANKVNLSQKFKMSED